MLYLKQSQKVLSYFGELRSPDAGTPFVLYRKRALEGGVQVAKRSVVLPAASPDNARRVRDICAPVADHRGHAAHPAALPGA